MSWMERHSMCRALNFPKVNILCSNVFILFLNICLLIFQLVAILMLVIKMNSRSMHDFSHCKPTWRETYYSISWARRLPSILTNVVYERLVGRVFIACWILEHIIFVFNCFSCSALLFRVSLTTLRRLSTSASSFSAIGTGIILRSRRNTSSVSHELF